MFLHNFKIWVNSQIVQNIQVYMYAKVTLTDQPVFGMDVLGQENPVREATVHQGLDALDPLCITWHVHLISQL